MTEEPKKKQTEVLRPFASARLLGGCFGKYINERILKEISFDNGTSIGPMPEAVEKGFTIDESGLVRSNLFYAIIADMALAKEGWRVAGPRELSALFRTTKNSDFNPYNKIEDYFPWKKYSPLMGVVLCSINNPNMYLAHFLRETGWMAGKIRHRQIGSTEVQIPLFLPLCSLRLYEDQYADHGLVLALNNEDAKLTELPDVNQFNPYRHVDPKTGFPYEDKENLSKIGCESRKAYMDAGGEYAHPGAIEQTYEKRGFASIDIGIGKSKDRGLRSFIFSSGSYVAVLDNHYVTQESKWRTINLKEERHPLVVVRD